MGRGLDILLIEDNEALAANVAEYLEGRGHRVDFAFDGRSGLALALEPRFDLILLDLALPRMDGLALCRAVRERAENHVPIIMVTARDTLDDKLLGFAEGADDYLTKPFALAELAARCEALANRGQAGTSLTLEVGPLLIDRRAQQARREGRLLRLSPIGWQILLTLAEEAPALVPRHQLSRRLWGDEPPDSDSLRSHVHLLRLELDKPFEWPMLETVHGVGFRLRSEK